MSSDHPAASLYTPTPIEEAYAIYVFEALFGNFQPDGSIHLEAKATLKSLERSEVDAIILKTIWSVADPDSLKCLTHISQFHVVLRLIALGQDGLLEKEINRAFMQQRNQTTPVTVFKKCLWMSLDYTDCPLPKFKGVAMPAKSFLESFAERLQGKHNHKVPTPAPAPAPAPIPITTTRKSTTTPSPIPAANTSITSSLQPLSQLKQPPFPSKAVPNQINIKNKKPSEQNPGDNIESAIQQMETLGVSSPNPNIKGLKELDPENFELYQEQAALERAIRESQQQQQKSNASAISKATIAAAPPSPSAVGRDQKTFSHDQILSEEEALQKAIYESTYAASPPRPAKAAVAPVAAVATKKEQPQNWLRLQESSSDSDSDDSYKKKKKPTKGDSAYSGYVASLDPTNASMSKAPKDMKNHQSPKSEEFEKKPAAKPSPAKTPAIPPKQTKPPPNAEKLADEYPQAVQELVMNGFELQKAIQGYKMLGDNFDDIVLFLTSSVTVKELVINGFNIHKVVQAYELIGDNMDDLLAYLMTNT